jgi:hypothetical protein
LYEFSASNERRIMRCGAYRAPFGRDWMQGGGNAVISEVGFHALLLDILF